MKKTILILVTFFFEAISVFGQDKLTVEDAVSVALRNNYDILVARNTAKIDSTNNTPGNAGMLPSLNVTGSNSYSLLNNNYLKYSDGTHTSTSNSQTNFLSANVGLGWTLFDGGKMFVTKNKLNEIQSLGEIQYKDKVMQTVSEVIIAYYDVVRQKQELTSINEVITYNLERVKISQTAYDAGLAPKTNLLQAKIDLNVYQENAINQQSIILAAKRTLNQLLGRNTDTKFEVIDSIRIEELPDTRDMVQKLETYNTSIQAMKKQVDISELSVKEIRSQLLPRINFNAGLNLTQNNYSQGSTSVNRTIGPQIGGTFTIPIYQAGNVSRQVKTARIQLQSDNYDLENTRLQVAQEMQNALTQYENQFNLLKIEKDNAVLAKENLEITIQRLRFGQTTSLEVSQAENNFVESLTRLINFEFNLKLAETRMKQLLSGL